ncbi:hypothetical protein QR98_0101720 [Sarcoptes scabiei]|uniref:Uncharacterized protein n=1 Tax=Sarcoptes scabiei TaxID=52283 RepID=A0A132AL74_SARSC|nr:hypothetical protein QR98_0101720 [Sarcoptes scabiei]
MMRQLNYLITSHQNILR